MHCNKKVSPLEKVKLGIMKVNYDWRKEVSLVNWRKARFQLWKLSFIRVRFRDETRYIYSIIIHIVNNLTRYTANPVKAPLKPRSTYILNNEKTL